MTTSRDLKKFQIEIKKFARQSRRSFPWRNTKNPYRILVSEIMLQQTQTDRVIGYYQNFLKKFPTFKALAEAPLSAVLAAWQGLGYNRRGRFLWSLARTVQSDFSGKLPRDATKLMQLPGIGQYTANAICVFAFDQSLPLIETNIRAVYIERFFKRKKAVHDREILPLIEKTIDRSDAREWFYALMDYGSALKKRNKTLTTKSAHYVKQSTFVGSRRQLRGIILRFLVTHESMNSKDIRSIESFSTQEKSAVLIRLCKEALIEKHGKIYRLARG